MGGVTSQISQIQSLEIGKGPQYLLNEAYKILGNPFILFNMDYRLIAYTENIDTDDYLWNEIVETGVYSSESIKLFLDENFIDTVASTEKIVLLTSDKLKYERLYGRVFNSDNSTVADLIMVACDKPFEAQDPKVFEAVCEKLSQEISSYEFYQHYGVLYHENLMCQLLNSDIGDKIVYSDHLANLYEGLDTNLYVAVADISRCSSKNRGLEYFRDLFKKSQPEFKYAIYSNHIVIIVSTDEAALNIKREFYKLRGLIEYNDIYVGISGRFENLYQLREYYCDAIASLKKGLESQRSQKIFSSDDTEEDSMQ